MYFATILYWIHVNGLFCPMCYVFILNCATGIAKRIFSNMKTKRNNNDSDCGSNLDDDVEQREKGSQRFSADKIYGFYGYLIFEREWKNIKTEQHLNRCVFNATLVCVTLVFFLSRSRYFRYYLFICFSFAHLFNFSYIFNFQFGYDARVLDSLFRILLIIWEMATLIFNKCFAVNK